jgi:hypothetical protein
MYEAVCLSVMLDQHEEIRKAGDFLIWVWNKLTTKHMTHMLNLLKLIEESYLNYSQLAELHVLFRHWGHPTVHEELGCEKIRVIGKTRSYPTASVQRRMVGLMNKQFFAAFLSKHGRPHNLVAMEMFTELLPQNGCLC